MGRASSRRAHRCARARDSMPTLPAPAMAQTLRAPPRRTPIVRSARRSWRRLAARCKAVRRSAAPTLQDERRCDSRGGRARRPSKPVETPVAPTRPPRRAAFADCRRAGGRSGAAPLVLPVQLADVARISVMPSVPADARPTEILPGTAADVRGTLRVKREASARRPVRRSDAARPSSSACSSLQRRGSRALRRRASIERRDAGESSAAPRPMDAQATHATTAAPTATTAAAPRHFTSDTGTSLRSRRATARGKRSSAELRCGGAGRAGAASVSGCYTCRGDRARCSADAPAATATPAVASLLATAPPATAPTAGPTAPRHPSRTTNRRRPRFPQLRPRPEHVRARHSLSSRVGSTRRRRDRQIPTALLALVLFRPRTSRSAAGNNRGSRSRRLASPLISPSALPATACSRRSRASLRASRPLLCFRRSSTSRAAPCNPLPCRARGGELVNRPRGSNACTLSPA